MKKVIAFIISLPAGIFLILFGSLFLIVSEYRYAKFQNSYGELKKNYIDIESDKVDIKNNGNLVVVHGELNVIDDYIEDPFTGFKIKANKLIRVIEMYQYNEYHEGGYATYEKEWSDRLINSEAFEDYSYHNPTSFPLEAEEFYPSEVYLGAFKVNKDQLEELSKGNLVKNFGDLKLPQGYKINSDNSISNSVDPTRPQIGDIRITYYYNDIQFITLVGKQNNSELELYQAKNGFPYYEVIEDNLDGAGVVNFLRESEAKDVWINRLIGLALNIIGFVFLLVFNPITKILSHIYYKGNSLGDITFVLAIGIGIVYSLALISGIYFFFKPIISIIILALILVFVVLYLLIRKRPENDNL